MSLFYRYFFIPVCFSLLGVMAGGAIGYVYQPTISACLHAMFYVALLAIMEISLSFDNAIVNANILRTLDPLWTKRFLLWGMPLAVFGMRLVFPLLIVSIAAGISPLHAVNMAIYEPQAYAHTLEEAHYSISAFGGIFLLMVALKFFFNPYKTTHWLPFIEHWLPRLSRLHGIEEAIVLSILLIVASFLGENALTFLDAGIIGLITFIIVHSLSALVSLSENSTPSVAAKNGLYGFIYLEVLDSSFSFDGVISAFAISNNLFIIALGLGIGAFYVRSLTIMLVEKNTLHVYPYLEHGAFWAIFALGSIMLLSTFIDIPETLTGLIGMSAIGLAFFSSLKELRSTQRS